MLNNYFQITIRILKKHLLYSSINILGLALGIACCLLISLYVWDERSIDQHYAHKDQFYRVTAELSFGGEREYFAGTPHILAPTISKEFPEVDAAMRLQSLYDPVIKIGENRYRESWVFFADESVFPLFELNLANGAIDNWKTQPNQVIISAELAEKYFPNQSAVGAFLDIKGLSEFQVSGVMEKQDAPSHLSFNMILPYSWAEKRAGIGKDNWNMIVTNTYLKVKAGSDIAELSEKITQLASSHTKEPDEIIYSMDLVKDIYLLAKKDGDLGRSSDIKYIYIFSSIALLVLLIAVLNFINLSSARAIERAREVGVRKVFGANRRQLIYQFLGEAGILVFMALLVGLGMTEISIPYFNQLVNRELIFPLFQSAWLLPGIVFGGIILTFLAGAYPALILSGFSPLQVFGAGVNRSSSMGGRFRSVLVTLQFSITFILISSTIIINQQLNYVQDKDLGFNKEQVIVVPLKGKGLRNDYQIFKQELLAFSGIESGTASYHTPGRGLGIYGFEIEGEDDEVALVNYSVDEDFLKTLELEIVEGRAFDKEMSTDSIQSFLVNEALVKQFGWEGQAIGKEIIVDDDRKGHVIGVLKDFHFQSLYQPVTPLVMQMKQNLYSRISLRVKEGRMKEAIAHIKTTFNEFAPEEIFDYSFMNEDLDKSYNDALVTSKVLWVFSGMAILIASLGLLGLVVANTLKKTKEIGIRKVLGASERHIFLILVKQYVWIILFAFIFTLPVTIWLINQWLSGFAYHISPGISAFAAAFAIIVATSLMTVGYFSFKASTSNPIEALRYE